MSTHTTLFLTTEETATFAALSASLRDGWTVVPETGTAYESVRQIAMRYSLADFTLHPEVQEIVRQVQEGKTPDHISLDHVGSDIQKEFYYMIGARGVASLIGTLLREVHTDQDIEALAMLSVVRHHLLELNASATHR